MRMLLSPSGREEDFQSYLDDIRDTIVAVRPQRCIVAGDFNAKSFAWDPERGRIIAEWMAQMDLEVVKEIRIETIVRGRQRSVLDLTLKSPRINITQWKVSEEENVSDHRKITFSISEITGRRREQRREAAGWRLSQQNIEVF